MCNINKTKKIDMHKILITIDLYFKEFTYILKKIVMILFLNTLLLLDWLDIFLNDIIIW